MKFYVSCIHYLTVSVLQCIRIIDKKLSGCKACATCTPLDANLMHSEHDFRHLQ